MSFWLPVFSGYASGYLWQPCMAPLIAAGSLREWALLSGSVCDFSGELPQDCLHAHGSPASLSKLSFRVDRNSGSSFLGPSGVRVYSKNWGLQTSGLEDSVVFPKQGMMVMVILPVC